jgi:signal transduction histidine kinase
MTLRADRDELVLSVRDDGVGFDAAAATPREDCFGLEGMRERVELAGGTLVVMSSPGHGTDVVARVPLIDTGAAAHTA